MPALTLRQRTNQRSQNWGVRHAASTDTAGPATWVVRPESGVQFAGRQSGGGTRTVQAPKVMKAAWTKGKDDDGDAQGGGGSKAALSSTPQRGTDKCPAAEAHDGHPRGHARAVGKPLDERRDRRDVAQSKADATQDAVAQIEDPELVEVDTDRGQGEAAAEAEAAG